MISRYLICARRVVQDSVENDASAIGIVEDFVAQGFPMMLSRLAVLWHVEREDGDADEIQGTLRFAVDGELLQEAPFVGSFQGKHTSRLLLNIAGFTCKKPGLYSLEILINGQRKAESHFRAESAPNVVGQQPPPTSPTGGVYMVS